MLGDDSEQSDTEHCTGGKADDAVDIDQGAGSSCSADALLDDGASTSRTDTSQTPTVAFSTNQNDATSSTSAYRYFAYKFII